MSHKLVRDFENPVVGSIPTKACYAFHRIND